MRSALSTLVAALPVVGFFVGGFAALPFAVALSLIERRKASSK